MRRFRYLWFKLCISSYSKLRFESKMRFNRDRRILFGNRSPDDLRQMSKVR